MDPLRTEEPRDDAAQSADLSPEARGERIAEARELQKQLETAAQSARRKLQDAMAILTRQTDLEAAGKVARVRRAYEPGIAEKQLKDPEDHLIADLNEAREELFETLSQRLTKIIDEVRDELKECRVELRVSGELAAPMPIEISAPPEPGTKAISPKDFLVGAPIAVVGVVTMNPVLMAVGASAVLMRGTMALDRSRKEIARKQLADISSDYQRQLSLALHQATVESRSSLTYELEVALATRRSDLVDEISSLEALGRKDRPEPAGRRPPGIASEPSRSALHRRIDGGPVSPSPWRVRVPCPLEPQTAGARAALTDPI